jgi:fructoselysine-6-P-deglycase FrlB-like protein
MLKIKEMACTPAEAYHGMELMHGPKYAVNKETLIMYLLSDSVQDNELRLLNRIKELGGHIGIICEKAPPHVMQLSDDVFELQSGLSENARLVLVMLLMQLYAYYRSLAVGRDIE